MAEPLGVPVRLQVLVLVPVLVLVLALALVVELGSVVTRVAKMACARGPQWLRPTQTVWAVASIAY